MGGGGTELTRVAWKLSLKSNFSFTLSGFFFKDLNIFAAQDADGHAQSLPSFLTHPLAHSSPCNSKCATRSSSAPAPSSAPTKPDPAIDYLRLRVTPPPAVPRTPLPCPSIYIPRRPPHLQFPAQMPMPPPMRLYCHSPFGAVAEIPARRCE